MNTEKEVQQIEIERHVAEYLARGGQIHKVDHTANRSYRDPIKHTRKEQVNRMRKKSI